MPDAEHLNRRASVLKPSSGFVLSCLAAVSAVMAARSCLQPFSGTGLGWRSFSQADEPLAAPRAGDGRVSRLRAVQRNIRWRDTRVLKRDASRLDGKVR